MDTNQIYGIVNDVTAEALGSSAIKVTDTASLVSLGSTVLLTSSNTEAFLNTLAQRIGKTIISYRKYRNKLADMVIDDFTYGAILQKIKVSMPTAEADQSFDLVDGESVDHYTVSKPVADQKLFVTRTPYQFHVTIQRIHLEEAFLSDSAMGAFIGAVFGEVQNAIELALENLGRACICNFAAEMSSARTYDLVTLYNADTGENLNTGIEALEDPAFLRYMVRKIHNISKKFTDMSTLYNDGSETRFTPFEDQRIYMISDVQDALETVVQYSAFHKDLVSINAFKELNFWQAAQSPLAIKVKRASDSAETTLTNVVAMLRDRDSIGIYKKLSSVLTTPVNAAGAYYNQYYHEKQLWFNDLSENGVIFTLN